MELRSLHGLWLLTLLGPLVVLYLLKIRRQKLKVASTWLWAEARRDLRAKTPFRRLILQLPLLLQALALLWLAFALARPASPGAAVTGDHLALVVDVSASMATRNEAGGSRLDAAKAEALRAVQGLTPGSEALVIEAGRRPQISAAPDRDVRRLRAAIERLRVNHVEGNLRAAIALASDRLRQERGDKRILVFTDSALPDAELLQGMDVPLDIVRVGSKANNLAIVRIDVRGRVDPVAGGEQIQVFALIENFGDQPRDVFVTLRQRNVNEALASRRLRIGASESTPVVLTFEPAPGDRNSGLIVELSPGDALALDDRAYGRVPHARDLPVVVAPAGENVWVERALSADPNVNLIGARVDQLTTANIPADALVIVSGACPKRLPGGDLLVLNPPKGVCRTATVGDIVEAPSITSWRESDARLRFLTLDSLRLRKARRLELDGTNKALVRAREGVLMADISSPGRTGTLVAFDVGESNWPLKASFVLFIRNLVELSRAHRARGVTGPGRTGEPVQVRVPIDLEEAKVEAPDGAVTTLPARDGLVVIPEPRLSGFYYLDWKGARPGSVLLPVNLTSARESDLGHGLESRRAGQGQGSPEQAVDSIAEWSWLCAALALLFITFDVWWLTRQAPALNLWSERPRLLARLAERARRFRTERRPGMSP